MNKIIEYFVLWTIFIVSLLYFHGCCPLKKNFEIRIEGENVVSPYGSGKNIKILLNRSIDYGKH